MDTTIIALRSLYVALGGDAADVANLSLIPDLINAIAALITSGATKELPEVKIADNGKALVANYAAKKWVATKLDTLPAVTAEDNGKVLKVVNGAWDLGTDETTAATT